MLIVNPMTAWALLNNARQMGINAVVQTAAASALGRMIIRLGQRMNIQMINIVRRAEQIDELHTLGAKYVLNSSADDFDRQLREICKAQNVQLAFDAVAGEMTGRLLQAMPNGARVTIYGGLSDQPCTIPLDQLIFRGKSVDGFWLSTWLPAQEPARLQNIMQEVQALMGSELQTEVRGRYGLQDAAKALHEYAAQMSGGKILFTPR